MPKTIRSSGFVFNYDDEGDPYGPAMWEGLLNGWESTTLGFMVSHVDSEAVFIDVGAASGIFTLLAGSMGADVIAYEVHPNWFRLLKRNVEMNEFTGALTLENRAVTGSSFSAADAIGKRDSRVLHTSVIDEETWANSKVGVQNMASILDSAPEVQKQIVVKMDIEGAEFAILRDKRDASAFARKEAILFVSLHPGFPYNRVTRTKAGWLVNATYSRLRGLADCYAIFKKLTRHGTCSLPNGRRISKSLDFVILTFFGAHDFVFDFRLEKSLSLR